MKQKSVLLIACLLLVVLPAAVFGNGADDSDSRVLRISTNHTEVTPSSLGLAFFGDRVSELTDGSLTVEIFHSSVLGSEREVMEQIKAGAVDATHVSTGFLNAFVPIVDIFGVPYLFRSSDHYWNVLEGEVGHEIIDEIETAGYKFLYWEEAGSRSFYNNVRPIYTPEDVKNLKIRVMGSDVMLQTMTTLGANPTTTAFAEVYNALQTGVIDGAENNSISVSSMKHNEVAKYYSLNAHMRIPDVVLMSDSTWSKLSSEEQEACLQAAKEAQEFVRAEWDRQESAAYDEIRETTAINEVDDMDAWIEAVAPLHESLSPKFGGMIEQIKAVN